MICNKLDNTGNT